MKLICTAILLSALISCSSGIKYPDGGYDFRKTVKPEDSGFYFLPIRDSFSRKDSFLAARESIYVDKYFDEPNLSLQAAKRDIFRLNYSNAFGATCYITLTENLITVKNSNKEDRSNDIPDSLKLTPKERKHLDLFRWYYPIEEKIRNGKRRWLDSLVKIDPELLDVNYYFKLIDKMHAPNGVPKGQYDHIEIPITSSDFRSIVSDINNSGYWKLPVNIKCDDPADQADGFGYTLEANAGGKYNCVTSGSCENQQTMPFAIACQKLLDKAGVKKIYLNWHRHADSDAVDSVIVQEQEVNLEPIKQPKEHNHKKR
jgi:hypothetical protein